MPASDLWGSELLESRMADFEASSRSAVLVFIHSSSAKGATASDSAMAQSMPGLGGIEAFRSLRQLAIPGHLDAHRLCSLVCFAERSPSRGRELFL